jgi:hypothetical protein
MKHHRIFVPLVIALAGCDPPPPAVDWLDGAHSCLSETIAAYDGKTYAEMHKAIGQQDSRKCRQPGHAYEVLITVSPDAENPPDRIQIDFDAFDDDDPPANNPVNRTVYLQPGEILHATTE